MSNRGGSIPPECVWRTALIASFQMREILRRLNPVWRASRDGQVRRGRENVLQQFDSHGVSIEKKKDSCGLMCVCVSSEVLEFCAPAQDTEVDM